MNDWELDKRANALAFEKNISYVEALNWLVSSATPIPASSAQTRHDDADLSDAQLDARATAYARQHGVSYSEALTNVVVLMGVHGAAFHETRGACVAFNEPAGLAPLSADARMTADWIEVFKAGTHVSDQGQTITFTQADIENIACNYQPGLREAPLVVGHPQNDMPARGWVEALQVSPDGRLLMRARQVDPLFAEEVKQGRFKKRSAALYPPQHPNNPTPGKWLPAACGLPGSSATGHCRVAGYRLRPSGLLTIWNLGMSAACQHSGLIGCLGVANVSHRGASLLVSRRAH